MKLSLIYENNIIDSKYVYRGMSNVEWIEAIKRGYVLSDCRFAPYEHQDDISCFGDYEKALYYATTLPIEKPEHIDFEWRNQSPREISYKGIVIEVPRELVIGHDQDNRVHKKEYWAFGPIPINKITRAWEFTPISSDKKIKFDKKQIR